MAAGDAVQLGQPYKIAFGNHVYTGYMPEDGLKVKKDADISVGTDERNAVDSKLIQNPREVLSGTWRIKSAGSIDPPTKGSSVQLTPPHEAAAKVYMVEDADVEFSRGVNRLSMTLVKEDSMTYTV